MKRFQSQIIYGSVIIITGLVIAALSYDPSRIILYAVVAGMFIGGVFAFITAAKNKNVQMPKKYHGLQGAGMFAYALGILMYGTSFEMFINITMAFLLYFGITDIIFGFQLMKVREKINMSVIVLRMLTVIFMAIGAVVILAIGSLDKNMSLLALGVLIALCGVNFILFANATRKYVISV